MRNMLGTLRLIPLLFTLGAANCTMLPTGGALTPEQATLQYIASDAAAYHDFAVLAQRPWQNAVLVLYRATREDPERQDTRDVIGLVLVRRAGGGWNGTQSVSFGGTPKPPLVEYDQADIDHSRVVFGHVLDPNVGAIEVVFTSGTAVRDPADNDAFLVFDPGHGDIAEVRVHDDTGAIMAIYTAPSLTHLE